MYGSPTAAKPPANDLSRPFQMSSGLLRYRSAPSSLIGEVCEDFIPVRSSSPETETMFARFLSPDLHLHDIRDKNLPPASASSCGGGVGAGGQRKSQHPPPAPPPVQHPAAAAEESPNVGFSSAASQMMYNHQHQMMTPSSMAMDSHHHVKDGGSCSNLIRHSSSPAGLFTNLNVENGYGVMRGIAGYRNGNEGGMGAGNASNNNRLKSQISFSSRQSSLMSQISEMENESIGGYTMSSWGDSPILSDNNFSSGLKRPRENKTEQTQNVEVRNGLSHQFSLPKTSSEMTAIEKFLQFQDSVPCKIRAKRGCATHPRSIAERVRRTRISERMRKLQELVPNMDKVLKATLYS